MMAGSDGGGHRPPRDRFSPAVSDDPTLSTRQAGGGPTIYCAWCHLPASFVWSNRDPGLVDDNADVNPYWPIEVERDTPTCARCEDMIDRNQLVEMIERAHRLWLRDLCGKTPDPDWEPRPGWRKQSWETTSARVAAWLARRDVVGEIPWE